MRISSGRSRARGASRGSRRAVDRVRRKFARARRRSARTGRGDPLRDLSDFQPAPRRARRAPSVAADELHARVDALERSKTRARASDAMLRTTLRSISITRRETRPLARRALRATARPRRSPDADEERHRRRARELERRVKSSGRRRSVSTTGPRSPSSLFDARIALVHDEEQFAYCARLHHTLARASRTQRPGRNERPPRYYTRLQREGAHGEPGGAGRSELE